MANVKSRRPSARAEALRRSRNTTRLPSSLRKELGDCEGHSSGGESAATSGRAEADSQRSRLPQQRQRSRKELRKQLRVERRQQKHEHQRLRKRRRTEQDADADAIAVPDHRNQQRRDQPPSERAPLSARDATPSEKDPKRRSRPDSEYEGYGMSEDSGSISAAAAALKQQQRQQHEGHKTLQRELRALEKRLGIRGSGKNTEGSREQRRAKLREELKEDGFDLELQDILDDILGSGFGKPSSATLQAPVEGRIDASGSEPEGSDLDEASSGASEDESEGQGEYDGDCGKYGVSLDSGSIGVAAAALKEQQQQHQSDGRLHAELQMLEKRLGISPGGKNETDAVREKRRRKLREELKEDGFDLELQDVLDDILGTGEVRTEASGPEEDETDVDETFSGRETVREEDASESEGGSAESEDGAAQSEEESSLGPSLKGDGRGGASPSKVYVAPHRRRQGAGTSDARPKAFSLEAIKVEVVRALNRVSEGNAEPVLHQLLRVLQIHAADVRRGLGSGKHVTEALRAYTLSVRQLLREQLMQSCIYSRFSTNSLIATQTALCCALGRMWDIQLCQGFLEALAVCFSEHFPKALVQRSQQQPDLVAADTASLITRHATVGVCCMYDFGFVSPRLFVELIRRVAGLDGAPTAAAGRHDIGLSDYHIELLLLLLRLGGGKLRQDDAVLFTATWKELQGLVQPQQGHAHLPAGRALPAPESHAATAETGRLRALLLELQDLKAGKQKDRLMLVKASQDAMRRWLSSSAVFGPTLLSAQFQIDGSWADLEKGQQAALSTAAAAAAQFQLHQHLNVGAAASAPDAAVVGAAANRIQQKAALLRFNTELQQSLFGCLMMANDPDDALRVLQNSGHLSLAKNTVTQTVAVAMQCCLQEKLYNPFYGLVLSRLCGICGCGAASVGGSAACTCFLLSEKGAARYRRTVQRGLAAQASAAHGFSLRRLLNLAKLTAYLIRLGVADLRIVRFLNFDSAEGEQGPMGLSGKLGVFLREVCVELLCNPKAAASPLPALDNWEVSAIGYFKCLGSMSDICEAFIALLQDVVLPEAKASGRTGRAGAAASRSSAELTLKASVVKSAIRALLANQQPDA